MDYFELQIGWDSFLAIFEQPASAVIWDLFAIVGWLGFAFLFLWLGLYYLAEYKEGKATADWKWVVLAIDVPPQNVQTPRAVEQLFAHLAGALDSPDIAAKYRHGHRQRWFSFEIISIEGYIQFLIRTEEQLRDLVEAAVYAQYPEAEITEVEDYTAEMPETFPNDTYDMWAADFVTAEDDAYPIRTYEAFEHNVSKDSPIKDPMATFLESFSRIGPGEHMWFQILIQPIGSSWKEKGIKKVKELIGEKTSSKSNMADVISNAPLKALEEIGDQVFGREASAASSSSDDGPQNNLQFLTPGQRRVVEAIEDKISKIGFKTKMRGVYIARKEVFRPQRGVNALIGAINQYNVPSANSIVPKFGTGASYFFAKSRSLTKKALLMKAYKKRKISTGATPFVLNIEELATIWHFPLLDVKTPLIQKSAAKRVEPPSTLPIETVGSPMELPGEGTSSDPEEEVYDIDAGGYSADQQFG